MGTSAVAPRAPEAQAPQGYKLEGRLSSPAASPWLQPLLGDRRLRTWAGPHLSWCLKNSQVRR